MLARGRSNATELILLGVLLVSVGWFAWLGVGALPPNFFVGGTTTAFNGDLAMRQVDAQMKFGPRITGTAGNQQAGDYIVSELRRNRATVTEQKFTYKNTPVRNIIGVLGKGKGPVLIVGAHYDTRKFATEERNPTLKQQPVPGADDGASGTAVLLELARSLEVSRLKNEIWLTFFDAEDNGDIDGWEWTVGSTYMASHLQTRPAAMILVDMVGDKDQNILLEQNSTPALRSKLWTIAYNLGYGDAFLNKPGYSVLDDHSPFLQQGIPSVDIIDFDYAYWHTTQDTADKLSPLSLERVGRVLKRYLEQGG